ncbi:MAG TPA: cytochrome c [Vicinamibacterales bacterium]|nr:cytochrome c [Vicinamibacterales bacterium]
MADGSAVHSRDRQVRGRQGSRTTLALRRHHAVAAILASGLVLVGAASLRAGGADASRPQRAASTQPAALTGEALYRSACITCHGPDGRGGEPSVIGFDAPIPDFTDCLFATAEPDADWYAVVHEGGPIRALGRHMPAFGDALTEAEMNLALGHIRTFCAEPAWPRGELNLPRAFFTEKAFPENEAVWETGVALEGSGRVTNTLVYERRFGPRTQIELKTPILAEATGAGDWNRGIGDIGIGVKHTFYSSLVTGRIAAAGMEVVLPTGKESLGLGSGHTVVEPFAMWGQILPGGAFLQMHGGLEIPTDAAAGTTEGFIRTGIGMTFAADRGFGRAWSPQVEVLFARPENGTAEWDVVPQVQVTLSKLQHVMLATGVRIPVTDRHARSSQFLVYVLWDWFDGSPFDFWK